MIWKLGNKNIEPEKKIPQKTRSYLNDWRKYLFVAAIVILVMFCLWFESAFRAVENTLVREKAWEKQQDLDLLCEVIDKLAQTDEYNYGEVLRYAVVYIETHYTSTFAQLFDDTLTPLTSLSPGVGGGAKHNPLDYPEFVAAVTTTESGTLVYRYETAEAGARDVYMCYRWVPTGTRQYLVAVGISKYTVKESIDDRVIYGTIALIGVTAVFIVTTVILLCRLGHIYEQRTGDKWRSGGDSDVGTV